MTDIDLFQEEEPLRNVYDRALVSWLLDYARPHRAALAGCVLLLLLLAGLQMAQPYIIKTAIDDVMRPASLAATEPARWAEALALETVRQTYAYIADNHGEAGMFATLFLGILDPATGRLTYVNGGHEPPLFLQGGQPAAYLKATGLAVGALPDSPYRTESIVFHPGDGLVLYTDGVTDADDEAGVHFSKQRLVSLVSGKSDDARTLLDSVIAALNAHVGTHAPADDVTLLCMRKILW